MQQLLNVSVLHTDTNECDSGISGGSQVYVNTPGSCRNGYQLHIGRQCWVELTSYPLLYRLIKEAQKGFWLHARSTCSRHLKLHASNDFLMKVKRAQLTGNENVAQNCENRNLQETFPFIANVCSVTYPDIFPINSTRRVLLDRIFSGKFIYRNFLLFSLRLFWHSHSSSR